MYISKSQSIGIYLVIWSSFKIHISSIFFTFVLFLYFRPTTTITKPTTDVLPPQPIANQKSYFFLNIFLWIHLNIFWWVDFLWLHNKWFSQSKPSFEKSKFLNGCLRATNPILVCFLVIKWTRHLDLFDILIWKSRFTLLLEWLFMKRTSLRRSL